MILSCTCKNAFRVTCNGPRRAEGPRGADFQDSRYGTGRRVHNRVKSTNPAKYCCTLCNTERSAGKPETPQG